MKMAHSQTIKKIHSFRELSEGWSYGEGIKLNENIIKKAVKLAEAAHRSGLSETDAFPGLNGEIMMTVYHKSDYWEFTIEPDERVTFVYERDDALLAYEEGLDFFEGLKKIYEICKFVIKKMSVVCSLSEVSA